MERESLALPAWFEEKPGGRDGTVGPVWLPVTWDEAGSRKLWEPSSSDASSSMRSLRTEGASPSLRGGGDKRNKGKAIQAREGAASGTFPQAKLSTGWQREVITWVRAVWTKFGNLKVP